MSSATVTQMPAKVHAVAAKEPPAFLRNILNDYVSRVSHVFILHGEIYDFVDNSGYDQKLRELLSVHLDDNKQKALNPNYKEESSVTGLNQGAVGPKTHRMVAFYNSSSGLTFSDPNSRIRWVETMKMHLAPEIEVSGGENAFFNPSSLEGVIHLINRWFFVSKKIQANNSLARLQKGVLADTIVLTLVFTDADSMFPNESLSRLTNDDRSAIVSIRNWSQDKELADNNRIILVTRHLNDIHESIRSELAVAHRITKPALQDRQEWIANFDAAIQTAVKQSGKPWKCGTNSNVNRVDFAEDFSAREFAIQAAGMNRQQMKDIVMHSWLSGTPINFPMVQERKKRALEAEYGGMIDIQEPTFGFDHLGGHELFKAYAREHIIKALRNSDLRMCSRGVLMTGPGGTGKTLAAMCLAKEANMNFLKIDLGKVFGGIVGETEKKMDRTIEAVEAAQPCIGFIDELDTAMAGGRSSGGDSGTSSRMMGTFMKWMSDPARRGKVVMLAATNRPDLLDGPMIRAGRFDIKLPMLPPAKGDAYGRWNIMAALSKQHKIVFSDELLATKPDLNNPKVDRGLSRLLADNNRIWTGAETQQIMEKAFSIASRAERMLPSGKKDLRIRLEDFERAFNYILPNTEEVEQMTNLALLFVDDLEFVPEVYREQASDKQILRRICGIDERRQVA